MKVNFTHNKPDPQGEQTREAQGKTVIAANIVKQSVTLDRFGNEINWKTKQIIKKAGEINE